MNNLSHSTDLLKKNRDLSLDILRGIAIFLMILGNTAGSIFAHPYPVWITSLVALHSFVPALFVLVAGMVVSYTVQRKHYTLRHYALRALGLIVAAALILDVFVWEGVPFVNMDVLYLIAIALPATYLFLKLSTKTRWITVGLIFLLAPILQMIFGYTPQALYISLIHGTVIYADIPGQTGIINHWFIDGWFPIFPWLGFAFLGANLGIMRFKDDRIVRPPFKRTLYYGISAIAAGILMYTLFPTAFYIREGFSEFIYPPTLAYILIATGQILILLALIDVFHSKKIFAPLIVLGESSLFVYITHYALIDFMPMNPSMGLLWALGIGSVLVLFALSYVLRHLRRKYPDRPFALRYVLGT